MRAQEHPYLDILLQVQKIPSNSVQAIISRPPIIQRILSSKETDFMKAYQDHLMFLNDLWSESHRVLKDDGTMWIIVDNYFYDGQLLQLPFTLGKKIQSAGFIFRNIIIWYNTFSEHLSRDLKNRYSCILFFAKNKAYKFDMDPIREPHIWKDVEWGRGRRSRYNPKGKDPSNFWLKTESEKGNITRHVILQPEEIVSRCILVSTNEKDRILDLFAENAPTVKVTRQLNRVPVSCFSRVKYSDRIPKINVKRSPVNSTVSKSKSGKFVRNLYIKSSEEMNEVDDSSVQVIITSPPYWGMRDYDVPAQIGFNESYSDYLNRLENVGRECYRVLKENGSLWININKRFIDGNILLFPEDIIERMRNVGFYLKEIVIWHRPIFVPATGPKNFADRHEYILFFTKSKENYFLKTSGFKQADYILPENEKVTNVWRMFRKIGNIGKRIQVMVKERKIKHTAVYPKELVRRIILLCSNKRDIVLDPFAGSGTTLVVANVLGRGWIGYEINPDYKEIIRYRLSMEGESLSPWLPS